MAQTMWCNPGARTLHRLRRSRVINSVVAAVLLVPLLGPVAQAATRPVSYPAPTVDLGPAGSDPGKAPVRKITLPNASAKSATPTAISWPAAATGTATLNAPAAPASKTAAAHSAASAMGSPAGAGSTPVTLRAVAGSTGSYQGPGTVSVRVLDHATAVKDGISGVVFSATPQGTGRGQVQVGVDYASFAQAYGGNYASRLRLVELPACALTTPQVASCHTQTPLGSSNNPATHTLTANVTLGQAGAASVHASTPSSTQAAAPMALAADSSPSSGDGGGSGGQYGATSLKPSGSWSAGGSSGSFDYSYPITVSPAASDLVPTVGLSYDSGSVDGQTAATQAQADWLGDGWSTPENYVEQTYTSCSDNPEGGAGLQSTADTCYDGNILTISLNGTSTSLVRDDTTGTWKLGDDGGETVAQVTGGSNDPNVHGDEYWKVTERDGTSYYFGLNELPGWTSGQPTTGSVQSEPVYSAHNPADSPANQPNEYTDPCYNSTWSNSWCTMAYRWNLDYVTDVHGNAMAYYYDQDANAYAQNGNTTSATAYVRDAHLDHIDYGFTDGHAYGTIPDKVQFSTGDRCMAAASSCDPLNSTNASNWFDVPFDLVCSAGTACQVTSPSFFSTVRLTGITAEQYNGSGYSDIDTYTFTQTMPATGDDTSPTLWLSKISHTGDDTSAGGSATPVLDVNFSSIQEPNRVNTAIDGLPALNRMRISGITTETGAAISVNYELVDPCSAPVTLNPATNTSSCYPVYWTPPGGSQLLDWFNKYVVKSVVTQDPTGGSPGLSTSYKYLGGAAWHYDENEVVQSKYRTYGQYRGYGDVQTFTGQASDPQTESEAIYYRGMSDDDNSTAVTLQDSQQGLHDDSDQLAGDTLESTDYFYSGGPVADSTINSYWVSQNTASRARSGLPALTANTTAQVETWSRQAITDQSPTTWRTSETDTTLDATTSDPNFGLPLITYAHGDLSVSGNSQKRCTVTTYATANATKNIVGLAAEVEVDADPCGGTNPNGASAPTTAQLNALTAPASVNRPADVVSDSRTFYDLQPLGSTTRPTTTPTWPQTAPAFGDVSEKMSATGYSNGAFTYQASTESTYDSYGRILDTWDALGRETQTAYSMTNGLTSGQTSTNPLGQVTTSTIDPTRGIVTSTIDPNGVEIQSHFDGLGHTIATWLDSRPTSAPANYLYTYAISASVPTVVTTQTLDNESKYVTSETFYDALLRPRQTQTPTPQGGRLLTDTFYDSHGWVKETDSNYWDTSSTPDTTMAPVVPDDEEYQETLTSYDGLGKAVEVQSLDNTANPVVDQITYAQNTGDKTVAVPPAGGVAEATSTDLLGRTTELDQYTSAPTVTAGSAGGFTTVSITGGATQATDYLYNNVGEQTDVKDATTGEDWNTTYNLIGEATGKIDPDAGASSMAYDAAGELSQTTDARNKTVSYTYDALGRKTGEYDGPAASQTTTDALLASWAYDNSNGNVANMTDPIGHLTTETTYSGANAYVVQQSGFNVFGESMGETITVPSSFGTFSSTNKFTYTNTYSPTIGEPTSTTIPAAGALPSESVGTGYSTSNGIDLPVTLSSLSGSYLHNVTYTAFGQVGMAQYGSTVNAQLTEKYNPHTGALTDQNFTNTTVSAAAIDDTTYAYDQAGNPTSQTETRQGTTSETQCFRYDALDRLTQAWTATDNCNATPTPTNHATVGDGIASGEYWTSWTYDTLGQWETQTQHSITTGTADTTTDYTYGGSASSCTTSSTGANTLASTTTTAPSGTSTDNYCYDQDGNTTQSNTAANGQQSQTWNDLGELTAVTTASAGSSYIYDAEGNLLVQNDPNTKTLYLPNQQITVNSGNGTTTATRFYTLPGGGQVVRTGTGTNYDYEIGDLHGTSLLELDHTLTIPTWRQQTPYGAPRGTTTSWPDNHGFLGKPQDTTTGLTNLGARWYNPSLGRFTSLDPKLEPNDPQELNGYTYAADNPITGSDPTGLSMMEAACGNSCDTGGAAPAGNSTHATPATEAAAQAAAQAKAQLAADLAKQKEVAQAIIALQDYLSEQQQILALDAQDDNGSDGCVGRLLNLGACKGEEAEIANAGQIYCSGSAGWGCLIAGLVSFIPFGEIADALDITPALLATGSKALDAIAPGLSDAIATGLSGAQDLLGALRGKAAQVAAKIVGDQAAVDVTDTAVDLTDSGAAVDPRKLDYLFNKDIAANDHNTARAIQNASQLKSIGISDTAEMRAYVSAELEAAPAGGFDETFSTKYGNFGVTNTVLYGPQGALGVESTWQIMDDGSYKFTTAIFRGVNSSFHGGGG